MKLSRIFSRSTTKKKKQSAGSILPETNTFAETSQDGIGNGHGVVEWELRPGGMLVQKRESSAYPSSSLGRLIKVKVSYGPRQHDVTTPHQATFGDLKWALAKETGLQPKEQRLIYKGKEREDNDCLHIAGVEDQAKIILIEDPASKERKMQETSGDEDISKACYSIALIREEVDKLAIQFATLERLINSGRKVADHDFTDLFELLTRQLLELDTIKAAGEATLQKKLEVKRVQRMIESTEGLKVQNSHPLFDNTVTVTTEWETFDSALVSFLSPPPPPHSSAIISTKWEVFE